MYPYEQLLLTSVQTTEIMRPALIVLFAILAVLAISTLILTIIALISRRVPAGLLICLYIVTILALICSFYSNSVYNAATESSEIHVAPTKTTESTKEESIPTEDTTIPSEETTVETTTEPEIIFEPAMTEKSNPTNWNVTWTIAPADDSESYAAETPISFGDAEDYYPLPGVPTFRGDNYRSGASYGNAEVTEEKLTIKWTNTVGSYNGWSGIGWTGQPLLVQWDDETKQIMGLYDSKKTKKGLIEVIATTLDGYIYFYDLEDGTKTRDPLWIGMSVKGTATLDPRGIPMLYVGAGLTNSSDGAVPKMFVISLVENKVMYSRSAYDSWAGRSWCALDSSPMVSGEADTLIWPCENGIIYSLKLNTEYNKAAGTLSINPETVVKVKYSTKHNRTLGYESSIVIVKEYAFIGDNGGIFFCVNLNTMELVWAQEIKDDLNATPVFEWGEDNQGYLYLGTSMEYGQGTSYLYKLNATTGEIIWEHTYSGIVYDYDVSGGVLSSPVLGKEGTSLEGQVIFSVSKTHGYGGGTLVSLNCETGEVVWEKKMDSYAWSSPVAVYNKQGTGYLVFGDASGNVHLINDKGETLTYISLGSVIEASPVVFDDMFVIAARSGYVYGVKIS